MKRRVFTAVLILTILVNFSILFTSCYSKEDSSKLTSVLSEVFYKKGLKFDISDNYLLASQCYNIAIMLQPDFAKAYFRRGVIFYRKSKYTKAISDFTKYISYDTGFGMAHFYRGMCYEKLHNLENALLDYNKAIELYPNYSIYYTFRGKLYYEDSEFYTKEKAEEDFKRACELGDEFERAEKLLYFQIISHFEI